MNSINTVAISGNLTRDPELRQTSAGKSVCQLGVAVNESYKDSDGQWKDRAHFIDVVVWAGQGEACAQNLSKGSPVSVQGRLSQRSWEKDGVKHNKVEVVADRVIFGAKPQSGSDGYPF
jgi:single-strand DNA-binding protein